MSLRRDDIDLAGDRWSGDLATVPPAAFRLIAADRAAIWARAFSADVSPPWRKSAWSDPGVKGTGERDDGLEPAGPCGACLGSRRARLRRRAARPG